MRSEWEQTLELLDASFTASDLLDQTYHQNQFIPISKASNTQVRDAKESPSLISSIDTSNEIIESHACVEPPFPQFDHERFTITSWLASGSFGDIWLGMDHKLSRKVAIKIFRGNKDESYKAFIKETRYLQFMEHPGIPAVLDISDSHQSHPYLVMQYIEGQTLKHVINKLKVGDPQTHHQFTFAKRIDVIIQLLRILSQVHQKGIIHRDIKPANIMLGDTEEVYLMDWGLATAQQDTEAMQNMSGTPLYMSPEQYLMKPLTPQSDLYAVAAVAYELLSLHTTVYPQGNVYTIALNILDGDFHPVSRLHHEVQGYPPSEFEQAIMLGLSTEPQNRPSHANAMKTMFENSLAGHFQIICARTFIKTLIFALLRWIDRNPYKNVPLLYLSLFSISGLLVGLGMYLAFTFYP